MKKLSIFIFSFFISGCTTFMNNLWEGTKTQARSLKQKGTSLIGLETESRLVSSKQEFCREEESDFIPLNIQDITTHLVDYESPQAKDTPGEEGGKIPGIEAFQMPSKMLAAIFEKIYFNTDGYLPKSKEYLHSINKAANYLKKHKTTYIFVEGHCDQRASESYNLSLGSRRANYIRNLLIKEGVNPNQIFTISYGKERLADLRNNAQGWAKNRRVTFKIYEKGTTL